MSFDALTEIEMLLSKRASASTASTDTAGSTQSQVPPFARYRGETNNGQMGVPQRKPKTMLDPDEDLLVYATAISICPNMRVQLFQTDSHSQTWEPRACKNHRCPACGMRWLRREHEHLVKVTEGVRLWMKELKADCDWTSYSKKLRARGALYLAFRLHDRIVVLTTVTTSKTNFLWDEVKDKPATIKRLLGLHVGKKIMRSHEWAIGNSPVDFTAEDASEPSFRKIRLYTHGGISGHRERCDQQRVQIERKGDVTYFATDSMIGGKYAYVDTTRGSAGKDYLYRISTPEYGTHEWKEFSLALGTREERPVAPRRTRLTLRRHLSRSA